jgi:hypothetical protein
VNENNPEPKSPAPSDKAPTPWTRKGLNLYDAGGNLVTHLIHCDYVSADRILASVNGAASTGPSDAVREAAHTFFFAACRVRNYIDRTGENAGMVVVADFDAAAKEFFRVVGPPTEGTVAGGDLMAEPLLSSPSPEAPKDSAGAGDAYYYQQEISTTLREDATSIKTSKWEVYKKHGAFEHAATCNTEDMARRVTNMLNGSDSAGAGEGREAKSRAMALVDSWLTTYGTGNAVLIGDAQSDHTRVLKPFFENRHVDWIIAGVRHWFEAAVDAALSAPAAGPRDAGNVPEAMTNLVPCLDVLQRTFDDPNARMDETVRGAIHGCIGALEMAIEALSKKAGAQ